MNKYLVVLLLLVQPVAAEINVYSARKTDLIKPLLDRFTEKTSIQVNLVTGAADTLLKRLELEGNTTPADILLTVDVVRLLRGKQLGLFQRVDSPILEQRIPEVYRDKDNKWFGLSLRSRVIVYAPDRVNERELSTYLDLADIKWRKRLCVRSSQNVYNQSLVAAMIANHGMDKTEEWATGLVANFARSPKGGDRDQIKAIAAGVCDLALVNNYYLANMLEAARTDEAAAAQKVRLFWPSQEEHGAHINISGAAILKPDQQESIQLLEFLASDEAQAWYAKTNHEYPIIPNIETSEILKSWSKFKADTLNMNLLGKHNTDAVKLMDRVGWK